MYISIYTMIFLNIYKFIYDSYSFFVCIYIKNFMKKESKRFKKYGRLKIKKEYSIYDFEDVKNLTDDEPIMF